MSSVRICTRPSGLAVAQAEMVAESLKRYGVDTEIIKVHSTGDVDLSSPLYKIGGSGIFVEEVNRKVINGEGDIAVHSAKDLPSVLPGELEILGVLPRVDPNDVFVSRDKLENLPKGSVVGTSSIRRIHELKMMRPDLEVENLRGNLDTRIRKLEEGNYDGIILAKAGLKRMQINTQFHDLDLNDFLPAPNQGIIAIVGKKGSDLSDVLKKISHSNTFDEMIAERKLVAGLNLGCSLPAAVLCQKADNIYHMRTRFYSLNSREYKEFSKTFSDLSEVDLLVKEVIDKVPAGYGFNFKKGR